MSLAENRRLRIFTLCALYVAQGIPWGFMATTLPGYLTDRGLSFDFVVATLSFAYLPYTFKWIWGPIIDTLTIPRFGRRRPWIILAQAAMAVTVLAMVWLDVTKELQLVAWMIFIHTIFNSLQDVASDALAVDVLDDDERGRANGLMFACKYGGGLIGGWVMAKVTFHASLDTALVVQVVLLAAIMLVPFFVRERPSTEPVKRRHLSEVLADLGQAFSLRSALVMCALLLGTNFAAGMLASTGYELFLKKLGWKYHEYSAISGGWGLAIAGTAAAVTGFVVERLGRRRVAAIAGALMALGWVAFALLDDHWDVRALCWAAGLYQQVMLATLTVAMSAMCMDLTWDRVGGTQFTLYMALFNFSTVLGQQFAVKAVAMWSFQTIYLFAACVQVAIIPLLLAIDTTELRRKLPLPRVNRSGIIALVAVIAFLVIMTVRASMKYL